MDREEEDGGGRKRKMGGGRQREGVGGMRSPCHVMD